MGQANDVYVISEDDLIEPARRRDSLRSLGRTAGGRGDETERTVRAGSGYPARALVASTLSMFVCGAGQAYNGQVKLGLLLFLTEVLAAAGHWAVVRMWSSIRDVGYIFAVGEQELFAFLAAADFLLIFVLLYNIAQAYHEADRRGRGFGGFRNPVLAGLASLILPGWGQLLNAELSKALFFLFCVLMQVYVVTLGVLSPFARILERLPARQLLAPHATELAFGFLLGVALTWILSAYDAFLVAAIRRR